MEERSGFDARWRELGQVFDPVENMRVAASGLEAAGRVLEGFLAGGLGASTPRFGAQATDVGDGAGEALRELRAEFDRAAYRFVDLMGAGLAVWNRPAAPSANGTTTVTVIDGVGTARIVLPAPADAPVTVRPHVGDLRAADGEVIDAAAVAFVPAEVTIEPGARAEVAVRVDTASGPGRYHGTVLAAGYGAGDGDVVTPVVVEVVAGAGAADDRTP